jgi:hypothetical protein
MLVLRAACIIRSNGFTAAGRRKQLPLVYATCNKCRGPARARARPRRAAPRTPLELLAAALQRPLQRRGAGVLPRALRHLGSKRAWRSGERGSAGQHARGAGSCGTLGWDGGSLGRVAGAGRGCVPARQPSIYLNARLTYRLRPASCRVVLGALPSLTAPVPRARRPPPAPRSRRPTLAAWSRRAGARRRSTPEPLAQALDTLRSKF